MNEINEESVIVVREDVRLGKKTMKALSVEHRK